MVVMLDMDQKTGKIQEVIATVQERNNKLLVQDTDDQDVDKGMNLKAELTGKKKFTMFYHLKANVA